MLSGNCFLIFVSSISLKYAFYLGKITIFEVSTKIMFLQFSCIVLPKNLPKTFPKRGPHPSKTDAQNMLVININFFTFRLPFWRLFGLQIGAETLTKRKAAVRKTLLDAICEHLWLLNSIIRRFGSVWEGLCEGFERSWGGFGQVLRRFRTVLEGLGRVCGRSDGVARFTRFGTARRSVGRTDVINQ